MELVEEATDAQRCAAETDLERVAEDLRKATVSVSTRTIVAADPASAILDDARLGGADLIAMTTHGWGGLKRWLVGSVTTNVLRHACTPLLVYRPPEVDTTCALAGPRHQASARVLQPASTAEGSGL
jgi:nucleotide-binding universal stress UspA family protein